MRDVQKYKDDLIAITDEGPLGFSEGTYIVSSHATGWAILCAQGEMLIAGYQGLQNIPDRETALECVKRLIDQERLNMAEDTADYQAKKSAEESKQRENEALQASQLFTPGDAEVPVQLLISLHNALPIGSPKRVEFTEYLETASQKQGKGHWTRGIRKLDSGDLYFSNAAFTTAVYRAKQEGRTRAVVEIFERLASEIDMVRGFHVNELAAASQIAAEPGEPLIHVPDYSPSLLELRGKLTALQLHVDQSDATGQFSALLGNSIEQGKST